MHLRWQEILGISFTIFMFAISITAFFLVAVLCLSLLKAAVQTVVKIFKKTPEPGEHKIKSVK